MRAARKEEWVRGGGRMGRDMYRGTDKGRKGKKKKDKEREER